MGDTQGDSVQANLSVLAWQGPVTLVTSMALQAVNAKPWTEGVLVPPSLLNSGRLEVLAGVGHLPAMQNMINDIHVWADIPSGAYPWQFCFLFFFLFSGMFILSFSGADLVAVLTGPASLMRYTPKNTDDWGLNMAKAEQMQADALVLLKKYTVPVLGLLLQPPSSITDNAVYSSPWLNAFALHVVDRAKVEISVKGTQCLHLFST